MKERKLTKQEERRQEKYQETDTFLWENQNPKGKIAGDCVIRAIASATGMTWDQVFDGLVEVARKHKMMPNDKKTYAKFLEGLGWVKHKQPRKDDNRKYTGEEWCTYVSLNDKEGKTGPMIAHIGGHHLVCIKPTDHGDGINRRFKVHDHWNSTKGCIGNYWSKTYMEV